MSTRYADSCLLVFFLDCFKGRKLISDIRNPQKSLEKNKSVFLVDCHESSSCIIDRYRRFKLLSKEMSSFELEIAIGIK